METCEFLVRSDSKCRTCVEFFPSLSVGNGKISCTRCARLEPRSAVGERVGRSYFPLQFRGAREVKFRFFCRFADDAVVYAGSGSQEAFVRQFNGDLGEDRRFCDRQFQHGFLFLRVARGRVDCLERCFSSRFGFNEPVIEIDGRIGGDLPFCGLRQVGDRSVFGEFSKKPDLRRRSDRQIFT